MGRGRTRAIAALVAGTLAGGAAAQQGPGVRGAPPSPDDAARAVARTDAGQTAAVDAARPAFAAGPGAVLLAQQAGATVADAPTAATPATPRPPTAREQACAQSLGLPRGPVTDCRRALLATAVTVTAVTGFVAWWSRGLDTRMDVAHEGWFGGDTYSGGIDKLGHLFSSYVGARLLNRGLGWAGVPAEESLPTALGYTIALGLGIELLDGLARGGKYGFSWQDLVMDATGVAIAGLAESDPRFDRWFALRWLHSSAGDPQRRYDRHQYYAVLRPSGWSALGPWNPLRYVELMVGYGAVGFRGESALASADERRRTVYAGIGLNLTELLERTVFDGPRGGGHAQWLATETLRYVQVPGTVATTSLRDWRP